jgi:NADH-quinone oxidoreductase subunit M
MWDALVRPFREHLPLWLMLLPIFGAVWMGFARLVGAGAAAVRRVMLVNLLLSVAFSVWLVAAYEPLKPASSQESAVLLGPFERFQFRDSFTWIGETRSALIERANRRGERRVIEVPAQWGPNIRFEVGVDGISVWFVVLSVLLVSVGSSVCESLRPNIESQIPRTMLSTPSVAWLWLQASLVGTFVALDVVLFVACWMSTLLSAAWLTGSGTDSRRHEVVPRFLKGSWWGGWLVLLGLGGLVLAFGWMRPSLNPEMSSVIFSVPELIAGIGQLTAGGENAFLWGSINVWLFWLLVVGFTVPLGLVPLHRPFVDAFASAPRGVGLVLAGALFKIGLYGWLRFIVPVFPELLNQHADRFTTLLGLSSLLAAALSFGERDWQRRIALATSSSIGLSLIGVATLTIEGLTGGLLRVLSHGLTAGLLVWLLPRQEAPSQLQDAVADDRCFADEFGDLQKIPDPVALRRRRLVRFALFAWIGLPGLGGFVAEFVTPFGLIQHEFNAAALSLMTSGLIAWMWVRADREPLSWSQDLWTRRDSFVAGTLVSLNIALGIAPQFVVTRIQPSLISLIPMNQSTSETTMPSEAR